MTSEITPDVAAAAFIVDPGHVLIEEDDVCWTCDDPFEVDQQALCPPCQHVAAATPAAAPVLARIDAAIFPGRCLACDGPIREGDAIVLTIDGPPWTHQECQ